MKIISKFTDYYDYLSKVYGPDEKVVYVRKPPNILSFNPVSTEIPIVPSYHGERNRYYGLSVCGKFYLLKIYNRTDPEKPISIMDPRYVKFELVENINLGLSYRYSDSDIGRPYRGLDEISKATGCPIFLFSIAGRWSKLKVELLDFLIPLSELQFHLHYEAEKLYQDLTYYINNVIGDGLDIRPPTEISNNDKITQYGFDLRQSFRHRK